jgi:hypothetical protein
MAAFDDPLTQSLTEQIKEIDEEVKGCIADLDSVVSSEDSEHRTPPCKNPCTPKH